MIQVQNWITVACTYNMIVKTATSAIILKEHSINNNLQKPDTKTKILDLPLTNLPETYILDYWKRQIFQLMKFMFFAIMPVIISIL